MGEVIQGRRAVKEITVVERIADGLRIPGHMLGLASREWETPEPRSCGLPGYEGLAGPPVDVLFPDGSITDPDFAVEFIENQLPEHYRCANYFSARQLLPHATLHLRAVAHLLDSAAASDRDRLLKLGSRLAEFLGWLHQDLGDHEAGGYWSDRAMEWAQEASDDRMQSYVLFRKSHQAAARASAAQAIGLARAAQRIPGLSPDCMALAIQQEATGHALQGNPKAALMRFDEALALASLPRSRDASQGLDTSYCTPSYVEIQRANCWIELGEPWRAIQVLEGEITTLPQVYRNDRSVYLARLARAYVAADEPEQGSEQASVALAIAAQTGSARTLSELATVIRDLHALTEVPSVAEFVDRFRTVLGQSTT
ncbi:hypothetical protein [Streptomyces qinzhouensis]|uniref:XRE family transcriptional regulator n=1 Tax=Streptomyces qinzhouensis TaxID=2599401 RepID=A0A5B8JIE6_9ACTN|nr:hypothetical protein [Streptomyces qinzhouensis]QDY77293.1 hypothetical protein FQU76_13075 [Streptomyces qinzhouensis]